LRLNINFIFLFGTLSSFASWEEKQLKRILSNSWRKGILDAILDIETTGVNPLTSRVTVVGILFEGKVSLLYHEDECPILRTTRNILAEAKRIIGWKIQRFDLPFLKIRGLRYGLNLDFSNKKILDLSDFFHYIVDLHSHDVAFFLGIRPSITSGGSMPQLFFDDKIDKIKRHCEEDLEMIKQLYETLRDVWKIDTR